MTPTYKAFQDTNVPDHFIATFEAEPSRFEVTFSFKGWVVSDLDTDTGWGIPESCALALISLIRADFDHS